MTAAHLTGAESPPVGHPAESNENNGSASSLLNRTKSAPGSSRRHSLPLNFLVPKPWNVNTSRAPLVESEEAAQGEHIFDGAAVAHRISALRQLNGETQTSHHYAKSAGARNSTFNHPVIVRTYSGTRPRTRQRELPLKKEIQDMGKAELPSVEAFGFKGIMESIQSSVTGDIERIAEICARSRYSRSNQYEAHMPPHGEGDPFLLHKAGQTSRGNGPTLQAVRSDDEHPKPQRAKTGHHRARSIAYGTLETIMSSSKSSEEDKTVKKSAKEIVEEIRGRAAKKALMNNTTSGNTSEDHILGDRTDIEKKKKEAGQKTGALAPLIIDRGYGLKGDSTTSHPVSATALISGPAQPQTSLTNDIISSSSNNPWITKPSHIPSMPAKLALIRQESRASTSIPKSDQRSSVVSGFSSWLSWSKPTEARPGSSAGRLGRVSNAEGSLRELLKSTETDRKGKSVDRASQIG